ncbi:MAG TPA: prolyl oligopeptidase family serine peptidase [Candidatus Paceibacterota bacterium]
MTKTYTLPSSSVQVKVVTPDQPTNMVVILLPGIGGGAFSDRFTTLTQACVEKEISIALFDGWSGIPDVKEKTFNEIYSNLDEAISLLKELGYVSITGIGKSFGGGILLTHPSHQITKKVLWAPAIGISESDSTLEQFKNIKLGEIGSLFDITINKDFFKDIETSTLIIHGTHDDRVPLSNSEKIISMMNTGELFTIEGANHSYSNPEHEQLVIQKTLEFLTN